MVCHPQQRQLFENNLAVRHSVARALEIRLRINVLPIDRGRRELVDKGHQETVHALRSEVSCKQPSDLRPQPRRPELAVPGHDEVQHLVDQTQSVEPARLDGALRVVVNIAVFVEPVGEVTSGAEIRENNVSGD